MNTRRFKTSRLILIIMYVLIAASLELFKFFGDGFFLGNPNRYGLITIMFSLGIIFLVVAARVRLPKHLWYVIIPVFLRILVGNIIDARRLGLRLYDVIQQSNGYFLITFAVPVYYVLRCRAVSLRRFISVLFDLVIAVILIKGFLSIFEYFTGTFLFPGFIYHESWHRYGLTRLLAPVLENIAIAMGAYLLFTEKKKSKRRRYVVSILLVIVYSGLILGSRFTAVWQVAAVFYIMMIWRKSTTRRVIVVSVILLFCMLLAGTGILDTVFGTFSVTNKDYGGSTLVRINALIYYINLMFENPVWGMGLLTTNFRQSASNALRTFVVGDLSDIGVLNSIVQYGIIITITWAVILIRMFRVGAKARRMGYDAYCVLIWGMAVCLILCNMSVDTYLYYSLSTPVAMAVTEFCDYELSMKSSGLRAELRAKHIEEDGHEGDRTVDLHPAS